MPVSRLRSTKSSSCFGIGDADIEVAVGGDDDAVDGVAVEVLLGQRIGEAQAFAARGRAAGAQIVERGEDAAAFVAGRRLKHRAGRAGIDDDRDAIARVQLIDQHAEALQRQRQLVLRRHRAGHVDQQRQIERRPLARHDVVALQADVHELAAFGPRRGRDRDVGGEGLLARLPAADNRSGNS